MDVKCKNRTDCDDCDDTPTCFKTSEVCTVCKDFHGQKIQAVTEKSFRPSQNKFLRPSQQSFFRPSRKNVFKSGHGYLFQVVTEKVNLYLHPAPYPTGPLFQVQFASSKSRHFDRTGPIPSKQLQVIHRQTFALSRLQRSYNFVVMGNEMCIISRLVTEGFLKGKWTSK